MGSFWVNLGEGVTEATMFPGIAWHLSGWCLRSTELDTGVVVFAEVLGES